MDCYEFKEIWNTDDTDYTECKLKPVVKKVISQRDTKETQRFAKF